MKQQTKIPEGWEEVELGNENYFNIIMGQSPPSDTYNLKKEGIPFYQGNADFGTLNPIARVYCDKPKKIAESGDILMSVRAPVGELNIANEKCCIGRGIVSIRTSSERRQFLYYYLTMIKNKWVKEKTTFEGIKSEHIYKKKILMPPIEEQKAIINIISAIDKYMEHNAKSILLINTLKKGMMNVFFKEESSKNEKISTFCDVKTGGTPSTKIKEYWNGNIKWMSSGEIHKKFVYDTEKRITELGMKNSNAEILPENSVMLAMNGQGKTRGKVAVIKTELTCNQSLAGIIPNPVICNYMYLFYNLSNRYSEIRNLTGKKGRDGLNLKLIRSISIPLPNINRQKEISSILLELDKKLELEQERKHRLERVKRGLMNDLLTGKKRVNIEKVLKIGGAR